MANVVVLSGGSVEWGTPQELFDRYNAIYRFETDVCAMPENAKCARYYDKKQDGLAQEWLGRCWMNPPYGRGIERWVKKAAQSNALVCCLLPASTDTAWWHDYVMPYAIEIEYIRGRLRFAGAKHNAPFASVVVVFDGREERP